MPDAYDNYAATPVANGGVFQFAAPTTGAKTGSGGGSTTTTNGTSTTNSSQNQTTNTRETNTQNTHSTVKNMTDESLAALDKLIKQLEGGGTDNMLQDRAARLKAIQDAQYQQQGYSKAAAMSDARGAMDAETARALNQILPSITRSAEGAGTSKNSMRALMTQNAASNAAQGAATIGIKAAADYGQVSNGISAILAQLVAMKDPAADALLAALNISKGAVQTTDSTTNSVRDLFSNVHTQGTSTTNSNQVSNTVNTAPVQQQGLAPSAFAGSNFAPSSAVPKISSTSAFKPNDMLMSFGPVQRDLSPYVGNTNGFAPSYADSLMMG